MANMIPVTPREFEPASLEGTMFEALELLSDDYYVFHSFRITTVNDNVIHESETDFVIFNPKKGIISLEAKAGQVRYENGAWLYGSGDKMSHDGPYNQASTNKYKLRKFIENGPLKQILDKCRFYHAVWFPSISQTQLNNMLLPPEADKAITLTKEALSDPEPYLDRIFNIEFPGGVETDLSSMEVHRLIREVFCTQFNVFPSASFDADLKKIKFYRLLKEQAGILNFLDAQNTAAINGAAGTGKTMIAVEKAQRHSGAGEKVLFLCYNAKLRDFLADNHSGDNISYYTIDGFVCGLCNTSSPDYSKAEEKLEDLYISGSFPYKHIIIDEAQDFGKEAIEEADILRILYEIVTDKSIDGTFYVFYDKLQLVQSNTMPRFIDSMDCRLTLHKNCRNTENIATTSLKPISERAPELFEGAVKGTPVRLHYCNDRYDEIRKIDLTINSLVADGYKDVVILTCKSEKKSVLSDLIKDEKYRNKYVFTTCRKFKGLEADAVILIDVDADTFLNDVFTYYVGASRARIRLEMMCILSDSDCESVLKETLHYQKKISKPKKELAGALNSIGLMKE